jgi:hypothetical protein
MAIRLDNLPQTPQSDLLGLRLSGVSGILMTTMTHCMKLLYRGANDNADRKLSWLDWSLLSSLSLDGIGQVICRRRELAETAAPDR